MHFLTSKVFQYFT